MLRFEFGMRDMEAMSYGSAICMDENPEFVMYS